VQQFICKRFDEEGLVYDDPPIVGVNDHPADPHFEPTKKNARNFKKGDKVLIDLGRRKRSRGRFITTSRGGLHRGKTTREVPGDILRRARCS